MAKKLYRNTTDRMIWGVCGGLSEYFDIDVSLIRVIFVVLALASGVGILLYIILAIIVPSASTPATVSPEVTPAQQPAHPAPDLRRGRMLIGALLVLVGVIFLLSNLGLWWLSWSTVWPLLLVAIGVMIVLGRRRR